MINDNVLLEKSLKFATRIDKLYQYLSSDKKESIMNIDCFVENGKR